MFIIQWMEVIRLRIQKNIQGPLQTEGKLDVRAIAYDPATGKSSPACQEKFDIARKDWKIIGTDDEKANAILDGDINSAWHQPKGTKMPVDLVIDLGKEETLSGFRYLPDQNSWEPGVITNYQFYISKIIKNGNWQMKVNFPTSKTILCGKPKNLRPKKPVISNCGH